MPTVMEMLSQAVNYHRAGELREAEQLYRHILQVDPNHSDSYHLLGVLAFQKGQFGDAVKAIRWALTLNPTAANYYVNLGSAYEALGQSPDAMASYQQAIRLQPHHAEAHCSLANAWFRQGHLDKALIHFQHALQASPNYAQAHSGLGVILGKQGQGSEAISHFHHALRINPNYAEARNNWGTVLLNQGAPAEAVTHFQEALRLRPGFVEAHNNLGNALVKLEKLDEAAASYEKALQLNPQLVEAHHGLGNVLERQEKFDEAIACYRAVLRFNPRIAEAYSNLGNVLARQFKLDEAITNFREALRLKPGYVEAYYNLGNTLLRHGCPDQAVATLRDALRLQPDLALAQSNLLFCLNYDPDADPDAVFREHCRWGQEVQSTRPILLHGNDADPERQLRIGYVSPDLRHHALMRYLDPVLSHHDPQEVEVFCYAEVSNPDPVTTRLQSVVQGWRWTQGLTDSALAERIRSDRIDILVDLAGHTCNNRLSVFARKPAPIQLTWLGYMNTTGLTTVDYRLTDDVLDPQGQPVRDTEKLLRLPGGMCCFAPPADALAVSELPALTRGYVTFGSLHSSFKLNARVLDLWSAVLKAIPTARLLMFHDSLGGTTKERFRRQFAERGISDEQLDLREGYCTPGYLGVYHDIDISLDPFPCTGGVTTCESLWMGVPVISLCGVRPAGRNSAALLARVGLTDWAVQTPAQYVAWAVHQAGQLERLVQVRAQLRDRMLAGWCDAGRFTRELENAYRTVWRRWCAGRAG